MAQQQQLPITFSEALNLTQLGINGDCVKFGTCSMESDRYITVCETVNGQQNVVIVDLANGNNVTRRPIQAEAAIMNPVSQVIALRAGTQLQIFNIELRARMKTHDMSEQVVFWRWISPNTVALVTPTAVFHWGIEGDAPTKVFDRHAQLGAGTQIISYQVSADAKWCLLVGISQGAGGAIEGTMQLYSIDKRVSQVLQGHAGCFCTITPPGRTDTAQVLVFAEKKSAAAAGGAAGAGGGDGQPRLYVMEIGRERDAPGGVFRLPPQQLPFPAEAAADFPVSIQVSPQHDIVYLITKFGFLYLADVHTGTMLFRTRISSDTVFVTTTQESSAGVLGITARKGQVLQMAINAQTLVPYVVNTLRNNNLAIQLATRLNLPGADDLYMAEFNRMVAANDVQGAARLAADSPQGLLRTPATIQRFQQMQAVQGQPQPVLQYFSVLLEKGKLNRLESLELARPVLQQGRGNLLEKWLTDDKLECSEELGDLLVQADTNLALSVYLRAQVPDKVINCFLQRGEFDKIVAYATKVNYRCDYSFMLQNLVRANPQGALEFAQKLAVVEGGPLIDINSVVEIFMSASRIQETTAFLLEALKRDRVEEAALQTRLLEINLLGGSPQVADAILANGMFTHYDRNRVAQLCERAGLFQRALEHFSELADIKRVIVNTQALQPEFLVTFFASLTAENSLECLRELMQNPRQNMNVIVQIATKYSEALTPEALIALFKEFKQSEGLYYYLGSVVNFSNDPLVHFTYIESAAAAGQYKEVERVCRDSTVYDPEQVKTFLMEAKLPDPRPLIHVCDRHDMIEPLTQYLYSNNLVKYIEVYVTKVSPAKTPAVVGKLLELDCSEDVITNMLNQVGQLCPVDELVEHVERRNRLRLLQPWLEARIAQGNTEAATHNAIGKIYITLNRDPQQFLTNNQFYDSSVIGAFAAKLDPSLAFLAYRRAGGACDDDLIAVCYENGLYKDLARYLVERQDLELWGRVLHVPEGEEPPAQRSSLIDQVVQTALPESTNADDVSCTVKAFMEAEMPERLIELLERIVLQGSDFQNNNSLQNLLILTAIQADPSRVMDYISRLDNYDAADIAAIAASEQYSLFEEAHSIYQRANLHADAISILLDKIGDLERAGEYADRVNEPDVWSKLGQAQLNQNLVHDSTQSFIKAGDATSYQAVIGAANRTESFEDLVEYLLMARRNVKEATLDTELVYAFARTNKLSDLEEFVASPNVAQIQEAGERCFDEQLYDAAKILFSNISNNAKLALCYVHLGQFREAVEAATKANAVSSWKEVNAACVAAGEFRLAAICGLHIIIHPDHLEELIRHYECAGHTEELIGLLEQGLGMEGAHAGIFTELGVLYSKYMPAKLMEHVRIFNSRMNVPKLLRACERAEIWDVVVYLYREDGQHDNAVRTMIDHIAAFSHDQFLDCVQKVRNQEIQYKAITFYLETQPTQLNRLLQVLTPNLDHARVVHQLRKTNSLALVFEYLKAVQKENLQAVNEAVNDVLFDNEDYQGLRESVDDFDNFDQIALAQRCEQHELLEMRRIAAHLYKSNRRFAAAMRLSKADNIFRDAIDTAAASEDSELVEELLRFFVAQGDKESFAATLFTCYALVAPDVAVELAWRNGLTDFVMPYVVQYLAQTHAKIKALEDRTAPAEQEVVPEAEAGAADMGYGYGGPMQIAATAYDPNAAMYAQGAQQGYYPQQGQQGYYQ